MSNKFLPVSQPSRRWKTAAYLKQHSRCYDDECGEEHVVNRRHHGCVERIQSFVEIYHLNTNAETQLYDEEIGQPIGELIVT